MSEDKKNTTKEKSQKEVKTVNKETEKVSMVSSNDSFEENMEETKKDLMGLEELPEEIKKKLEKKQSQKKSDGKKSKKVVKKKKKVARKVTRGNAYVKASYNNTIVTLTDTDGNVLSWASAGVAGFRGAKKATPYAAQIISRLAVGRAREEFGLSEVDVFVQGVGTGRESAVRSLNNNGLIVTSIKDITPVPHNGCRKRKPRRV